MGPGALVLEVERVGQVPLVEHERGGTSAAHRELGHPQVLGGDPLGGVAHDQRHVGPLGRAAGAQRRVVLERLPHLGLAAQAGGVDQHQAAALEVDREVDRVARGPGQRRDDHPLGAGEPVDQRGLADVGAPDHGQPHRVIFGAVSVRGLRSRGQLDDPVEQVAGAEALRRRHRDRLAEAERVELGGQRDVARESILLAATTTGIGDAAQQIRDLVIAGAQTGAGVDHQHGGVGVGERRLHLLVHRPGQLGPVVQVDPAGVDQRQRAAVPLGVQLLAVAGDAGALVHHRLARLGEPVDQRGLSDVGISDDRDLHGGPEASVRASGRPRRPVARR